MDYPELCAVVQIQLRRARWFNYAIKRFDLVSLANLIDWCARRPGDIQVDEERRTAFMLAFAESIELGEFGAAPWPDLAYLPHSIPFDRIGHFPLRVSLGQMTGLREKGHDLICELWAPREACRRWLKARGIECPPWLSPPRPVDRPTQEAVTAWMVKYHKDAADERRTPPKRESAFADCRTAIGATDPQMREAIKWVPNRRARGGRDRNSNRVANRVASPAIR